MTLLALQLPEWLSIGTILTAVVSLIGLIAALIKLGAAKTEANTRHSKLIAEVEELKRVLTGYADSISILTTVAPVMNNINNNVAEYLAKQKEFNADLASYIKHCFDLSNLSEADKTVLADTFNELFGTDQDQIIADLMREKESMQKQLDDKNELIQKANAENSTLQARLDGMTSAVKKTRKIQ